MKRSFFILSFVLLAFCAQCQEKYVNTSLNLDFEKVSPDKDLPDGWFIWGSGFNVKKDAETVHQGKYSIAISPDMANADRNLGCAAYSIPARYSGAEIELKAYIKMENVADGQIGLLLRIDGASGSLEFTNMQDKNIHGTADWTQYSVKLPYPKKAKTIFVAAMLSGTGKIWADDFQVLIDGKDIRYISPDESLSYKADKDNEFDKGSGIDAITLTKEKTEYLKKLGLVWGFVKYYHPAIAAGNYNWDYELFRHLPEILAAAGNQQRDKILYNWIQSLGDFEEAKTDMAPTENIIIKPDLDWIDKSGLDKELVTLLHKVKNSKRSNEHYYIATAPHVGNPEFSNERTYRGINYPDAGLRLLALYRYWNMIQYYFPYKHLIEEDWKNVLGEFIPKFVNAADELKYSLAALEVIGRVHDTHANIWGENEALRKYWGTNNVPYRVRFIENKAVITDYYDEEKAEQSGLKIGDIITSVNGKTVEQIIAERKKYSPASNYPTQLKNIAGNLLKTNDSQIHVKYLRNNTTADKAIKAYTLDEMNIHRSFGPDTCFSMINKDIAYIYPGNIKNSYIPDIMKAAADTKGLIIDLRCYPSEFIVFTLGGRLVDKNTDFVKFTTGRVDYPGYFVMGSPLQMRADVNNHYKGKVVVLIDENTLSQAEYTTMAFRAAPNTTVIGSTTAGADGNVSQIYLPGNIFTMISGIGVYYPDGTETQRVGIVPDIEVKPTIKGIREGKDEVLDRAIELINKN